MKKTTLLIFALLLAGTILFFGSSNIVDLRTAEVRADATIAAAQFGIKQSEARGEVVKTTVAIEQAQAMANVELMNAQVELTRAQAGKTNNDAMIQLLCILIPIVVLFLVVSAVAGLARGKRPYTPGPIPAFGDARGDK